MVVVCKGLVTDVEKISEDLHLEINKVMVEYIVEKTQSELLSILRDAEFIANKNKRKTVSAEDVLDVIKERDLPFEDFLNN